MAAPASERPRIRVGALILASDGRVVLVRHRRGDSTYHLLPGGGVEHGETLGGALMREVWEETGLEIEPGEIVLVNDTIEPRDGGRHVVNITFAASIVGGSVTEAPQDPRVEAVELVPPASLASLDLRPPLAAALAQVLAGNGPCARYLGPLWAPEGGPSSGPET